MKDKEQLSLFVRVALQFCKSYPNSCENVLELLNRVRNKTEGCDWERVIEFVTAAKKANLTNAYVKIVEMN